MSKTGRARWSRRRLVITSAVALTAPMCAVGAAGQVARAASAEHATGAWNSLSGTDQGQISKTLGREDTDYWVGSSAGVPGLTNSAQQFAASFAPFGAVVSAEGSHWGIGLTAVGHGDRRSPVAAATPVAEANEVRYERGSISEWYANGPAGLEQGFTLAARPVGDATKDLTLALGAPGTLAGRIERGGRGLVLTHGRSGLAYHGLLVRDARGRRLPAHLELRGGQILVAVADREAQYPITVDPFVQSAKLTASDGATNDNLGFAVAISGNTVVATADNATVNGHAGQGAAYVFVKPPGPGGTLTETAKLTTSDGAANDHFGRSVAVDGNTVVVGASGATVNGKAAQGAAYLFTAPAGGWATETETAKLTASDGGVNDSLGVSVGISGDSVVVGAAQANVGSNAKQGAAYVFMKPAGGWAGSQTECSKLTASDGVAGAQLGGTVAISGGTVVAGTTEASNGAVDTLPAAYVFLELVLGWTGPQTQAAKLSNSDAVTGDGFATAVAVSGATVVAGAPNATVGSNAAQGALYVFVQPPGGWAGAQEESARLTESDGAAQQLFGSAVGVSGDAVVGGAPGAKVGTRQSQGAAYMFAKPAGGWAGAQNETAKLTAADGAQGDQFGGAVGISGGTVVAGARSAAVNTQAGQGAAYVYEGFGAGTTGATGAAGATGATGAAGATGATGGVGPAGATGAAGTTGATGVAGPAGASGPAGAAGPAGSNGANGNNGNNGNNGLDGAPGPAGPTGPQGPPGDADAFPGPGFWADR